MTFTQHWKLAYIKLLYGEWRGADALQRLLKETNFETNEALMFSAGYSAAATDIVDEARERMKPLTTTKK